MPVIELDEKPSSPVPCCTCGRFVSYAKAIQHIEYGDYGTVHSVEFECPRCAARTAR